MKVLHLLLTAGMALGMAASCSDDDSFSDSPSRLLAFSTDTVKIDTVFSNVPSTTRSLWVFNRSGDGLRCRSVRLARGGESGFRVNVDGVYLGEKQNYETRDVEVRNKDSIRVFVELTSPATHRETPQLNEDDLIFTLESGAEQRVNLKAYAWDATLWKNVSIGRDAAIDSPDRPVVIYGGITVDSAATLTIAAGTTLYFHNDAGIDVYGRLKCNGTAGHNVVLRGDRIDRMFDYLPYDFVPGQWRGVRFHQSSKQNELEFTDIHGTYHGVVVDSADVTEQKLALRNVTIHNCQGYGLVTDNAKVSMYNTQITNTLNDCVLVNGGDVAMNNCTLAQFYPFDSKRGVALRFTDKHPLQRLKVDNTLITGYADDQLMVGRADPAAVFNFDFAHSLIRTPKVGTADSVHFVNVVFENLKDTVGSGEKHFVRIDAENLRYDFRLDSVSPAIGKADAETARPEDRDGRPRDGHPDIGAFEYIKP